MHTNAQGFRVQRLDNTYDLQKPANKAIDHDDALRAVLSGEGSTVEKPKHLGREYGEQSKDQSIVDAYEYRPPNSPAVASIKDAIERGKIGLNRKCIPPNPGAETA